MPTEHPHIKEPENGAYPFEVLLLSGTALKTKELGRFVIDLATLTPHKDSLTVDYDHDNNRILGFADEFNVTNDGFVVNGQLISDAFVDRLVQLSTSGTPYEASPLISEKEGEAVFLREGETAVVNGETHEGPMTIFRNVPLRGVSICPHGTDKFTHFTLLKERFETMTKDPHEKRTVTTIVPETTKLSAEGAADPPQVKDPDLAEFCEIYGPTKGLELWQSGADIKDIRTMRELIDKYGLPDPPADATELSATTEEEPPAEPDPKKDDEKTALKAELSQLKKELTGLSGEITKLRAAVPRGETQAVSHGIPTEPEKKKPLSSLHAMAAKIDGKLPK